MQLAGLNASLLFLPDTGGGFNCPNLSLEINQGMLQRPCLSDRLFFLTLSQSCLVFSCLRLISEWNNTYRSLLLTVSSDRFRFTDCCEYCAFGAATWLA